MVRERSHLHRCNVWWFRCALVRRPPIQMRFLCTQMRSRSTPADPNAFPLCSGALWLDACRSKCDSCVVRCALARRLSIQMRFLCGQMCFRLALVNPNVFLKCSDVLSLCACRSEFVSYVFRCALARRLSIKMCFLCGQMCFRSTPVYQNAFAMCSDVLSLDACRSKCVSYVANCAFA